MIAMSSDLEIAIDKFVIIVKGGLRYSKDHVWIKEENQNCILGLTDYAQRKGGDIVFLKFEHREGVTKEGEPVALYETIKAALNVPSPFDYEIVELNSRLEEQPELINEDPYGMGWIARVKPADPESLDALLSPENYFELIKELETSSATTKDV
jgi:glycine cleavage system H protein